MLSWARLRQRFEQVCALLVVVVQVHTGKGAPTGQIEAVLTAWETVTVYPQVDPAPLVGVRIHLPGAPDFARLGNDQLAEMHLFGNRGVGLDLFQVAGRVPAVSRVEQHDAAQTVLISLLHPRPNVPDQYIFLAGGPHCVLIEITMRRHPGPGSDQRPAQMRRKRPAGIALAQVCAAGVEEYAESAARQLPCGRQHRLPAAFAGDEKIPTGGIKSRAVLKHRPLQVGVEIGVQLLPGRQPVVPGQHRRPKSVRHIQQQEAALGHLRLVTGQLLAGLRPGGAKQGIPHTGGQTANHRHRPQRLQPGNLAPDPGRLLGLRGVQLPRPTASVTLKTPLHRRDGRPSQLYQALQPLHARERVHQIHCCRYP